MITNARAMPFRSLEDMVLFLTGVMADGVTPRMRFRYAKIDHAFSLEFYLVKTTGDEMELYVRKSSHADHRYTEGDVCFPCTVHEQGDGYVLRTSEDLVNGCREFMMYVLQETEFEQQYVQLTLIPANDQYSKWDLRWKQ